MSMQDPISSLLTGIRNAQARRKPEFIVSSSSKKIALLELLVREGYIDSINVEEGKKILKDSGLKIIPADDLDDAAMKIVSAVKGD